MQFPNIPIQAIFYLRTLTGNIFCFHNLKTGYARIVLYHETTAKKVQMKVPHFFTSTFEEFLMLRIFIYSPKLWRTGKEQYNSSCFVSVVDTNRLAKIIEQYFLIRGHSLMTCDRDFDVIKRKVRIVDYTLKEYVKQITKSSNWNKFTIVIPEAEDVIDFKKWWREYYMGFFIFCRVI